MITPSLKTALRNFRKYLLELHFRNLAISNPDSAGFRNDCPDNEFWRLFTRYFTQRNL